MEEFSEAIGKSRPTISQIEAGKTGVSQDTAMAIQLAWGASWRWILTGKGDMWCPPERAALALLEESEEGEFLNRPLIVGAASCGPGGEIQDPGPAATRYALRRDFARRIFDRCSGGSETDLFFLLCRGESMRPTIQDKEIVLVNTALEIRMKPRNNGIYLVRRSVDGDDARVKRIRLDPDRRQLVLASDNRVFPQATVDLDDIPLQQLILGRVAWVGRYLLDTDPPAEDW
jgi:transcriptional regulator with XRE-family HTH domain